MVPRCTDGIIFVVDSSVAASLEEARVELWRTMRCLYARYSLN